MCGIAGILGPPGSDRKRLNAQAEGMARSIRHRGPDRVATWVSEDGRCALGHARLSVIDIASGDQPMATTDGSLQVVYNGEIYNFRALRRALEARGHTFRTRSDTEVLLHGYRAWGEALPEHLEGMFAFAIWDDRAGRLFAARDRAGEKPLYWSRAGGRIAFASEPKALLALPWVPDELDPRALPLYLAYGYVPGPRTFYQAIDGVPPACCLTVEDGAGEVRRYWRLDWSPRERTPTAAEAKEEVRARFTEAVRARMVADVPLGAFLSGGIDSTLVVAAMAGEASGPLRTFSLGFADDPVYDETAFALEAARALGTEHTQFTVDAGAVDLVDDLLDAYDEPFGDSSAIPTFIVSRLAREHVTVALTGDGGDELFCGYARLAAMAVAERIPRPLAAMGGRVSGLLPHHGSHRHPTRRARRFLRAASRPPAERLLAWAGIVPEPDRLLRPELQGRVARGDLLASLDEAWHHGDGRSPLSRAMATTFETYLPQDLLVKTDRCSMAHGLELRSPFLDTRLMEFAASLPDTLRVRRGRLKWLLRSAFEDVLPPAIAARGKQGFGVPLPRWFRTHWRGLVESRLLAPDARVGEWLLPRAVRGLWERHDSGREDHGHALWALLTLESWLRRRGG